MHMNFTLYFLNIWGIFHVNFGNNSSYIKNVWMLLNCSFTEIIHLGRMTTILPSPSETWRTEPYYWSFLSFCSLLRLFYSPADFHMHCQSSYNALIYKTTYLILSGSFCNLLWHPIYLSLLCYSLSYLNYYMALVCMIMTIHCAILKQISIRL